MSSNNSSKLHVANTLFRNGHYKEALPLYVELNRQYPQLSAYRIALENCILNIEQDIEQVNGHVVRDEVKYAPYEETIHPSSHNIADVDTLFVVVTPVLNGVEYLATTLESVLSQNGGFFIDYIIKDGGSSDGTIKLVQEWCENIRKGHYPLRCQGIRIALHSGPDTGLYDAVKQGFAVRKLSDDDIMTYINADDVIANNAFETVKNVLRTVPNASWINGQPNVIDENGNTFQKPSFPLAYNRYDILDGLHDGRHLYFIQQEGSFWLGKLYKQAKGINSDLRLAGDFDLWRRFAAITDPLTTNVNLASFRKREGQLSAQIDNYYLEVDKLTEYANTSTTTYDAPKTQVGAPSAFFNAKHIPNPDCRIQRPGAVCFLNQSGYPHEVVYLTRTWLNY